MSEATVTERAVKERPILFSAPMVRAILDGSKSQTRRALRDQSPVSLGDFINGAHFSRRPVFDKVANRVIGHRLANVSCPYGQPGDRLWVREAWLTVDGESAFYRADYAPDAKGERDHGVSWRPAMFMPRWASRIELKVTGIRVERLQDISEADAVAEGVERTVTGDGWRRYCNDEQQEAAGLTPCSSAIGSFQSLWESINGPGAWGANPWVWVVEFRRIEQ